jgi:hypothetical protein
VFHFTTDYVPTFRCKQCHDEASGWINLDCDGYACGRTKTHAAHAFAVRCPCWLRRHADGIKTRAQEALQKARPPSPEYDAVMELDAGTYRWSTAQTFAARHRAIYRPDAA